jgi:hypothetical protein
VPEDTKIASLEDQIRALCARVVRSSDEGELQTMCADLRTMISEHIELVRGKVRELTIKELEAKKRSP